MRNVYTVGQVNSYIKNMFTQDYLLNSIYVKGELSNVKYHSSGHLYFTLKDGKGAVAGVMFAGNRKGLSFQMEDGQQVIVGGTIDVYERDGKYQLYAREISLDGLGFLYERFDRLKRELAEMGMFAAEYKQKIPGYIRTLGIITAPTGAAVRDIIQVASRRNPHIRIILYPAKVQGEGAAESIVQGLRALPEKGVDVIIAGRGGGSIEDLWAFNEEIVARAIFECPVPVISAVGHETDTTIADFVADLRAATPSAAAEMAVFDYLEFRNRQEGRKNALMHLMQNRISHLRMTQEQYRMRLTYLSPQSQIRQKRMYILEQEEKLRRLMNQRITGSRHRLALCGEKLNGLSPALKLSQGFSYTADESGRAVTDVNRVREGQNLHIYIKNGLIEAKVTKTEEIRRN